MSFLKALFGFGSKENKEPAAPTEEYLGFVIQPTPYEADGQYQTAGSIVKEIASRADENHTGSLRLARMICPFGPKCSSTFIPQ